MDFLCKYKNFFVPTVLSIFSSFFSITVQYRTRADAELAATQGSRFKNKKLIVVWQKNEDSETKTEKKHQNEEDELLYSDDENNTANEKVEQQIANDEELLEELA